MTRAEKEAIIQALAPALQAGGYDCVDIDWNSAEKTLCIYIARLDGVYVAIDDCVQVNHLIDGDQGIERFFDTEFVLEVSSPGLEPPLRTRAHFEKYVGEVIDVKLDERVDERMAGKGKLMAISEDDCVTIETSRGVWSFPRSSVKRANVVYTQN